MLSRLLLLLCSMISFMHAADFGVRGEQWDIAEEDLILSIKSKLLNMEQTGELIEHQEKITKKVMSDIKRPKRVMGVCLATANREFTFDPSFVVQNDITDLKGNFLAKKGHKINPLSNINYAHKLIFIDGDDRHQIKWAKAQLADTEAIKGKVVLIAGSPLELSQELGVSIFFDQGGVIVKKFGIKAVPAVAVQAGLTFLVKEILLDEKEEIAK